MCWYYFILIPTQYLSLNDYRNNELITTLVSKYKVRDYLMKLGEGQVMNRVYGVYGSTEENK